MEPHNIPMTLLEPPALVRLVRVQRGQCPCSGRHCSKRNCRYKHRCSSRGTLLAGSRLVKASPVPSVWSPVPSQPWNHHAGRGLCNAYDRDPYRRHRRGGLLQGHAVEDQERDGRELDAWAVHGVGGFIGTIFPVFLPRPQSAVTRACWKEMSTSYRKRYRRSSRDPLRVREDVHYCIRY